MASASIFPSSSPSTNADGDVELPERRPLRITEAKVFAQFDDQVDRDEGLWYLDTCATNHMLCCTAFFNLDTNIRGAVQFGDGSELTIEGAGMIVFKSKTGEHTPLTVVYFIPRLTTNIVSLGQLDEGGCDVRIKDGLLRIWDEQQRLLARVQRPMNRLYLLAHMLCLAMTARDCGMSDTGISTSTRYPSSGRRRWCTGYLSSSTFMSSVGTASPPSSRGVPFQLKPSNVQRDFLIWSMEISVDQSRRQRLEVESTFFSWLMT